jgi:type III secretory pathway component EscU
VPRINEDKNLSTFTVVKMSKDFIKREQKRKNNSKKRQTRREHLTSALCAVHVDRESRNSGMVQKCGKHL